MMAFPARSGAALRANLKAYLTAAVLNVILPMPSRIGIVRLRLHDTEESVAQSMMNRRVLRAVDDSGRLQVLGKQLRQISERLAS